MSSLVRHIRVIQFLLFGLAVTMIVAVWSFDEQLLAALDDSMDLNSIERARWNIDGIRNHISAHYEPDLTRSFRIEGSVTVESERYMFDTVFVLSSGWLMTSYGEVLDSYMRSVKPIETCSGSDHQELADLQVIGGMLEDPAVGTEAQLRFPDTVGGYAALHDAMLNPVSFKTVATDNGATMRLYIAPIRTNSSGYKEIRGIPNVAEASVTAVTVLEGIDLCLLRQSVANIFPNESTISNSSAVAVGVVNDVGLFGQDVMELDEMLVVMTFDALNEESTGATFHHAILSRTFNDSSILSDVFAEQYAALYHFASRAEERGALSLGSMNQLLVELNKVERSSLPILNISLPIRLVPWLGFPLLLMVQVYVHVARRTLLARSRRLHDLTWRDVGWIQSFHGPAILRRAFDWIAASAMVILLVGLLVRGDNAGVGCEELFAALAMFGIGVWVAVRDTNLGYEFDLLLGMDAELP